MTFKRLLAVVSLASGLVLNIAVAYLLTLLVAAGFRKRQHASDAEIPARRRFAVIVPAHNEEVVIPAAVRHLFAMDYPKDLYDAIVVADNCTDDTAAIARRYGATVLERRNLARQGKGYALSWAFEHLLAGTPGIDAVVVVDADCVVSPNLLRAIDRTMERGARAVQVATVVGNPDQSWVAALRYAAYTLINHVRPLGKSSLSLSSGLFGTGMAFSRTLLWDIPWEAHSLAEDGAYHAMLVQAGERVAFVPEASVRTDMPVTLDQARSQQMRWEGGRWQNIRRWTPRLLFGGLRDRSLAKLHAAIEPLVPPQALLAAANVVTGAIALLSGNRTSMIVSTAGIAGQGLFVGGGLLVAGAPASVFRALLYSPALVLSKLAVWLRILHRGEPEEWIPTTRARLPARQGRSSNRTPVLDRSQPAAIPNNEYATTEVRA